MKQSRRVLAVLLALVMVMTMIPQNTLAAKKRSKKKKYTVEISYVYSNGKKAAKTYKKSYPAGKKKVKATVKIPRKKGYKAKMTSKQTRLARKSFTKFKVDWKKNKIKYQLDKAKKNIRIQVVYVKNKTKKSTEKKKETKPDKPGKAPAEEDTTSLTDDPDTGVSAPAEGFMASGSFTEILGSTSVDVDVPEGAFDVPVKLELSKASSADEQTIRDQIDGDIIDMALVDISFLDEEGNEIEPAKKINVSIETGNLKEADNYTLYHLNNKGILEEVTPPALEDVSKDAAVFSSSQFSVYAIVAVKEDGSFDYEKTFGDSTVSIKAPSGAFPEGTEMKLSSVDPEELLKIATALGTDQTYNFNAIDISFWKDGKEIEPSVPVKVVWKSGSIEASEDQLVHLKDDGSVEKMEGAKITANKVVFEADAFSIYTTTRLDKFTPDSRIVFNPSSLERPSEMQSGELSSTHPVFEGYTFKNATYEKDGVISSDEVTYLGAFIYREFNEDGTQIGDDRTYIYYRTASTATDSDLIVKLAENETIHLNYESTPHTVTYQVVYNGTTYVIGEDELPSELADLVVTGPAKVAPGTTYEQAVKVSLPRGYSATVKMSNESQAQDPSLGLGSEPAYRTTDGWTITPDDNTFTIDGLYTIANVTDDLTVTVNLSKRASYQFSAVPAFSTAYFGGRAGDSRRYQNANPSSLTGNISASSHEFTFVFTTRNTGSIEWAMDSFNINKETINVPYVSANNRTASVTTVLTSGTVINLSAVYNTDATRRYTLEISNCYENITVTGGNLHNLHDKQEWVVQQTDNLSEFDYLADNWLPLKPGEPMSYATQSIDDYFPVGEGPNPTASATHYYWPGGSGYSQGYYMVGRRPNRNAPGTHYHYSGTGYKDRVIRFKVADGYINPQIKYITQENTDQYDRVHGVTLEDSATNQYHLITSEPDADGYYYFSLWGTETDPGLLSVRAELARYGASYAVGSEDITDFTIPDYDDGGHYGDGSLQGYNIIDNPYVAVADSAPVDNDNNYIFMYYTIEGDESETHYAPSQKIKLESISKYATYDDEKEEYVIPFVAHWQEKTQETPIPMTATVFIDDVKYDTVTTVVPQHSSVYVDIDSDTMKQIMDVFDWQLFYDEMSSDPFINDITEENSHVDLYLYSKYYVYHSGTGRLELHTTKEAEKIEGDRRWIDKKDFSSYADSDFRYGGYYKDYGGAYQGSQNLVQAAADYDNDEGTLSTQDIKDLSDGKGVVINDAAGSEDIGTHYDPQPGDASWTWDDAFKVKEQKPERARIYYIKEVPTGFLQNYIFYVYDRQSLKLASIYPMMATDDANYNDIGITFNKDFGTRYKFCKSIKFFNDNPEVATQILSATDDYEVGGVKTENVFADRDVHNGYLAIWKDTTLATQANASFTARPYWETPDGVHVDGIHTSTVNTGADAAANTIKITNTD